MRFVLTLVAALASAPSGMDCRVETVAARSYIDILCADPRTGRWFVSRIDRETGTVYRASGRRS